MRSVLVSLAVLLLAACSPSKSRPMLHSVAMDVEGPRLYDYRIDYGDTVLPFGNRGDPDFGGGRTYMAKMPLPDVAVATWRTAPAPAGGVVKFEVPIRDRVTDAEWHGQLFTLEFTSTQTSLQVHVRTGKAGELHRRLIFSDAFD